MAITVKRELVKDSHDRVLFRKFRGSDREHYNLRIYLDGPPEELKNIDYVEYILHPSFPRPRQVSRDLDNNFAISIWTWGMFNIKVTMHFTDGSERFRNFYLSYRLPDDTGVNYVAADYL